MLNWVDYKHVRPLSIGLSRITGDKGTLGGRWRGKLHIIKHYQNWVLGIYKIFYSVTIFVVVSSLSGNKHLLFLFFWRSVPFVLVRGVFTKIARNTPNSREPFVHFYCTMLQNAVVGMCGLCEAGVLCSVANGWGLQKGVVLLTTVNRPNYRLKP